MSFARDRAIAVDNKTFTEVADTLGLTINRSQWIITDAVPGKNLYNAHYTEAADMAMFGKLRGVVVDSERKFVVAKSFSFPFNAKSDQLTADAKGNLAVVDVNGNEHKFVSGEYSLHHGFEGVILRIFKHDGVVYTTSHRRLNVEKSHYGKSKRFIEMYNELGGPKPESLFDAGKKFSPYTYIFIVVHPDLLIGTKQDVGKGFLVLLSIETVFTPETAPAAIGDDYEKIPKIPSSLPETLLPLLSKQSVVDAIDAKDVKTAVQSVYHPVPLTLDDANKHLKDGFFTGNKPETVDPRLSQGEFVIIYKYYPGTKNVMSLMRVESTGYSWRLSMRNDDPIPKHRFFELMTGADLLTEKKDGLQQFKKSFVLFPLYDPDEVSKELETESLRIVSDKDAEAPADYEDRKYMIWMNLLMATPPQLQKQVINLLKEYTGDLKNTEHKLKMLLKTEYSSSDVEKLPEKLKSLYLQYGGKNARMSVDKAVALIMKRTRGANLYSLGTSLKKHERLVALHQKKAAEKMISELSANALGKSVVVSTLPQGSAWITAPKILGVVSDK